MSGTALGPRYITLESVGHALDTGSELRVGLTRWTGHYNADRPHSGLAGQTPDEAYEANENLPSPGHYPATETLQLAA